MGLSPVSGTDFKTLKKKQQQSKTPILLQYLLQYMLDKLFKGMSKTSAEEERKMYPMSVSWSHTNLMYHCHKEAYCTVKYVFSLT